MVDLEYLLVYLFLLFFFYLVLPFLIPLKFLHPLNHHLSFPLLFLNSLKPFNLSCFYLLDDHFFSFDSLNLFLLLSLFYLFNFFEPFNFHEFVLLFLLDLVKFPILLLFLQLPLPNRRSLCVCQHFVHQLYIINLFVTSFDCSVLRTVSNVSPFFFWATIWQLLLTLLLYFEHFLPLSFCNGLSVLFFFFSQLLLADFFSSIRSSDHFLF